MVWYGFGVLNCIGVFGVGIRWDFSRNCQFWVVCLVANVCGILGVSVVWFCFLFAQVLNLVICRFQVLLLGGLVGLMFVVWFWIGVERDFSGIWCFANFPCLGVNFWIWWFWCLTLIFGCSGSKFGFRCFLGISILDGLC